MLGLVKSFYTFWTFIEEASRLKRLYKTLKTYSRFLVFYIKNPEVRIKYSRKLNNIEYDEEALEKIREGLVDEGFEFNNITKGSSEITFDFLESKLNYRIYRDQVSDDLMNILVETKYASFYPLRKFNKLHDVTNSFNKVCETVSNLYEIDDQDRTIFAEFELERSRNGSREFEKASAKIIFDEEGFQIEDLYGNDQARFIFFLTMKWLMESKKDKKEVKETN